MTLLVHRLPGGTARRFGNDRAGHCALIRWLAGLEVGRIVFEPTGPYHRGFEHALATAGLPIAKINPRQARRFAEATGRLAKTDRVEAEVLARMGALLEPEVHTPPSAMLDQLRDLVLARRALIKDRTAAKNRSKHLGLPLLRRQNDQPLRQIEAQLVAIDTAIEAQTQEDEELQRRQRILLSIPGISAATGVALLL